MAILNFYGDASGKKDKTNVAVAGYVARTSQWDDLKGRWHRLQRRERVQFFHRSKMEPPFSEQFKERNWTEEHQRKVLSELHKIIRKSTIWGVGHAVHNAAFSQIVPPKIKAAFGGPYGWCVQACMTYIARWATARGDHVHYFFESGDDGQKEITNAIKAVCDNPADREKFRIAGCTFSSKKGPGAILQFQPADFLAYESYKQIERVLTGAKPTEYSWSAKNLIRPNKDKLVFWNSRLLLRWVNTSLRHRENDFWFS